ncbi:hypothetical protein, partial [Kitasatospora sp. NPDC007106]|uniref:hypothetical protein n=1 Tax=Kitasatospora sp. NPDC007106 TaxID=3156914 RepID=UPI0033E1F248
QIVAQAEREPGVTQAQVLVTEQGGRASSVEVLLLPAPGAEVDTERLRKEILSATFTLSTAFQHDPQCFRVRTVDALISNGRTGKTSDLVVREDS